MKTHDRTMHEALRQIPYGLYIVGVCGDGELSYAMLVRSADNHGHFESFLTPDND